MADIDLGHITTEIQQPSIGIGGNLLSALIGGGVNLLTQWRNQKFTEKWNKIQMQREDNAMQRRMADFKAAGINPLLALGSSGAASGGYTTPQYNADFLSQANELLTSSQQRRIDKAYTASMLNVWKNQEKESQWNADVARAQAEMARNASMLDTIKTGFALGIPAVVFQNGYGNNLAGLEFSDWKQFNLDDDVPFANMYRNDILSNDAFRSIAQQQEREAVINANWAKANQWIDAVGDITGDIADIAGVIYGGKKAFNPFQPVTPKLQSKERSYGRRGYTETYTYD